jgi:hypothetical protein
MRIGGMGVKLHILKTSRLDEGDWPVSLSGRFTPAEETPSYILGRELLMHMERFCTADGKGG